MLNKRLSYWRHNERVIAVVLLVWLFVIFVPIYFAIDLSKIFIFGWPFSFWVAAIGAPALFLVMIGWYAWYMKRQDAALRKQRDQ
jgi:putative solute:sodium symporter small subunit